MRRLVVLLSAATLSLVGGVIATSAVASGSTDTTVPSDAATEVHPIVGTWMHTEVGDPDDEGFTGAFLSDGVYIEVDTGNVSIGVWEATGPDTVAMTFNATNEDGSYTVRASITVDGDNLSADYTIEIHGEDAPSGQYGPGQVTGTRVVAEPTGTPVGSLDELFGSFAEGTEVVEGTAVAEGTDVAETTEAAVASSLEGRWSTGPVPIGQIRETLLEAGVTEELVDEWVSEVGSPSEFTFDLEFHDEDRFEFYLATPGSPREEAESGTFVYADGFLDLDIVGSGDTYRLAADVSSDNLQLRFIDSTETGTEADKAMHARYTIAFYTSAPFVRQP